MNSPDLNQGPSDLQSDALPTELSRLAMHRTFKCMKIIINVNCARMKGSRVNRPVAGGGAGGT